MKHQSEIEELVAAIRYKPGWSLAVGQAGGRLYLQLSVTEAAEASLSPFDGTRTAWRGAKHHLSPHMSTQEVVGVAYGAIRAAEEHEMREWFRFRGASIFNPHLDPEKLVAFARQRRNLDLRENAMTMVEAAP